MGVSLSKKHLFGLGMGFFIFAVPGIAAAEFVHEPFEVSGWIPYWRAEEGTASARENLNTLTEINPFIYTVRQDGMLHNTVDLSDAEWAALRAEARERKVRFIPTVMWANADAMHAVLSDPEKRQEHIRSIATEVYRHDVDGIDIDYEAKYARTRPHFSQFLKELYEAIGYDRWVMCTIESRTPLTSRYSSPEAIPADIEYANDFSAINRYCDRVRIMAYDQRRIDVKLNEERGDPYVPVADVTWVGKVIGVAAAEIDKNKLVIGVPTYGHEYDMFESSNGSGKIGYSRLWSLNPSYAHGVADALNLTPRRASSGELLLTFPAADSPEPGIPLPSATRVVTWSDAEAIARKVELAKKLGLRGIAIFKIDGGEDAAIWEKVF